MIIDGKKYCPGCTSYKPISEFHIKRASCDGLQWLCKPCQIAKVLNHSDPIKARARMRAWAKAHPERRRGAYGKRLKRIGDNAEALQAFRDQKHVNYRRYYLKMTKDPVRYEAFKNRKAEKKRNERRRHREAKALLNIQQENPHG